MTEIYNKTLWHNLINVVDPTQCPFGLAYFWAYTKQHMQIN